MAGLKSAILALALTTASGFAPATSGAAARERQRAILHLGAFILSIPTAARHFCVHVTLRRPPRAAPVALLFTPSTRRLVSTAWPRRRGRTPSPRRPRVGPSNQRRHRRDAPPAGQVAVHGYVPSGMSPEAYAAMKKREEDARKKKQFGKGGARGFESRSMQSFVAGLEKGETKHLFPVNPEKVRKGEIALKDVPYMQRGGSWTNSDLTQKKKGWMNTGADAASVSDVFRTSSSRRWRHMWPRESTRLVREPRRCRSTQASA